jgi:hypothetical protein
VDIKVSHLLDLFWRRKPLVSWPVKQIAKGFATRQNANQSSDIKPDKSAAVLQT